jgi:hypothetical protein
MSVTGYGDKTKPAEFLDQASEFFDGVHLGTAFGPPITADPPVVTAADLAAAYKADAKAADAKYKDHWLRVTGRVREGAKGEKELELEGGENGVLIKRGTPARLTVPVRAGKQVAATGKCRGLTEEAEPRVLLEDGIVARSPG